MSLGLSAEDLAREASRFGVADEQVRRDHLISHILGALSKECADDVVFFGGTALSRTHLVHARLSEDIDLIALGARQTVVERVTSAIDRGLLRSHGRLTWEPTFSSRDVAPAVAVTQDGLSVQLQILRVDGYGEWPVELRQIEQRYDDAPAATLSVPTGAAFAAWKTATWIDRHAPRDLYDLWAMSERGMLNAEAAALFAEHGPTGGPPREFMFTSAPSATAWESALAAQTRLHVSATEALNKVRAAWSSTLGESWMPIRGRRAQFTTADDSPGHRGPE
jgi:Nucleotidyl transferase AbiEii toxin, Type IV TA system